MFNYFKTNLKPKIQLNNQKFHQMVKNLYKEF